MMWQKIIQKFLRNQNKKWLKITIAGWIYQTSTNALMLYIEQGTGHYFYRDVKIQDK